MYMTCRVKDSMLSYKTVPKPNTEHYYTDAADSDKTLMNTTTTVPPRYTPITVVSSVTSVITQNMV